MTYVKVLPRERLAPGAPVSVLVRGECFLLVDLGGLVIAVDGACLRCGGPLDASAGGGGIAGCQGCGWRYDLRTGRVAGVPALWLHCLPVRVSGGDVYVDFPPETGVAPGRAPPGRPR